MDSGRAPVLLSQTECSFSSNITFRGGFPTNRQSFMPVVLTDGGASGGAPSGLASFQNGLYQGSYIYDISDTEQHIMSMVSGTLYQLNVSGGIKVTGVWNDGISNPNASQCWFCQPDIYFVVQDGTSTPIVMQGLATIRRAGTTEVPVGTAMAYGQGRLWLAQGRSVVAGDLLGGPTSVISFTEQTYLGEALYFGVPLSSGNVIGLIFVEQGDTATGQGELVMFARRAAYSIQASVPRQATQTQPGWQGTPGMQRISLTNIGGTGWRNLLNVNQDVFFRSKDGWRTLRTARNEQYGWGGTPISHEVTRVLYTDSLALLDYASSVLFKNRVFLTATPSPYKNIGASFANLVVLDLDIISSVINKSNLAYEFSPYFNQRGSPAYDGVWNPPNNLQILQVIQGEFNRIERCFAFCLNPATQKTEIWELRDDQLYDNQTMPIVSQIETKAYDFKLPDTLKELRRGELYFFSVLAQISVTVEFRSDGYQAWTLWNTMTLPGQGTSTGSGTPPANLCHIPACSVPGYCAQPGQPPPSGGYWFQHKLSTPPEACDPIVGKMLRKGYHFQLRITWSGPAALLMVMLHAEELVEDPNGGCP
jgi:hypothetical protein